MSGAANITIGSTATQAANQDVIQFRKKFPAGMEEKLAIAAATAHVSPD
jgi:hypothetical protein